MALSRRLWSWWRTSLRRSQINSEMDAEMRFHLEAYADDLVRSGVPRAEALRRARLEFGGIDKTKEECREASGVHLFETLICDLRYSARALRKSPGFTIVAVLTLALGIGANTAIFSAVNALMLRPLPFTAADQLVRIYSIQKGMVNTFANPDGPSALDVRDFAQRSGSFQNMVAYDTWAKNVSFGESAGRPEQMEVGLVPAAYFEILDIRPIIGRLFTEDENQEGKNFVAAISAQLWRNRFAGDPAVLGRKIRINGEPYSIVAVMPDVIP
ncbi:MAG: ABC transporter permease, partial [Candidatus Acidiferrales bacterium]